MSSRSSPRKSHLQRGNPRWRDTTLAPRSMHAYPRGTAASSRRDPASSPPPHANASVGRSSRPGPMEAATYGVSRPQPEGPCSRHELRAGASRGRDHSWRPLPARTPSTGQWGGVEVRCGGRVVRGGVEVRCGGRVVKGGVEVRCGGRVVRDGGEGWWWGMVLRAGGEGWW